MSIPKEYRDALLKAYTVVEWVAGEGFILPEPHYDADDLLLELWDMLDYPDLDSAMARKIIEGKLP